MFLSIVHDAENDLDFWSAKLQSAFYPHVCTCSPQILVCVLPVDGLQVRTSAFYTWPEKNTCSFIHIRLLYRNDRTHLHKYM